MSDLTSDPEKPLVWLHERFGISEGPVEEIAAVEPPTPLLTLMFAYSSRPAIFDATPAERALPRLPHATFEPWHE